MPTDATGGSLGSGIGVDLDLGVPLTLLVPTLALGLPGILLMLIVLLFQGVGAMAWIPLIRRSMGEFGLRRRTRQANGSA